MEKKSTVLIQESGQKANFFLFQTKSLGRFKCISLLIKYYIFNEKRYFESSWIVWLKVQL